MSLSCVTIPVRDLGFSGFILSCYYGLLYRSNSISAICGRPSKDDCWCSASQCPMWFRIWWVNPSTSRASMNFSSFDDPNHSILVHNSCSNSAMIIDPCLRLRPFVVWLCFFYPWRTVWEGTGRWRITILKRSHRKTGRSSLTSHASLWLTTWDRFVIDKTGHGRGILNSESITCQLYFWRKARTDISIFPET